MDIAAESVIAPQKAYKRSLFDELTKSGVWVDDSQIKKLTAEWGGIVKEGRVEIEIVELSKCA